jgi:hypothetical protein
VQGRALGAVPGDLGGLRELLRRTQDLHRFEPSRSGRRAWDEAALRLYPRARAL